jgi:hypothetical protein
VVALGFAPFDRRTSGILVSRAADGTATLSSVEAGARGAWRGYGTSLWHDDLDGTWTQFAPAA